MNARGSIPFGRAGVIVMAAALIPVVIKKASPFAKLIGNGFITIGKVINEMADAPESGTAAKAAPPKEEVKETTATSSKSASPTGKQEVEAAAAAASTEPLKAKPKAKPRPAVKKPTAAVQPKNPKRTKPGA